MTRSSRSRAVLLIGFLFLAMSVPAAAQAQVRKPPPRTSDSTKTGVAADTAQKTGESPASVMATIAGIVIDSLHLAPLRGAAVSLDGTSRFHVTDDQGRFRIDSVPAGSYRVRVEHDLLDSLGIQMLTEPFAVADNEAKELSLAIPSGETLVGVSCSAARRALGPSAIIGRVLDADTDAPVDSVRVSFAWSDISLQTLRRVPRVRDAVTGRDGVFRICGLSSQLEGGTLQASKQGILTSEVRVNIEGQPLVIQGLRIGSAATVSRAESDSAARRAREAATGPTFSAVTVQRGNASITGRVLNANGNPIVGARVDVVGTPGATLTRANGEFAMSGLPSGTQSLVVRQLGYQPVEQPVELSTRAPARVTVMMTKPAQVLNPVVVTAAAEAGLDRVGFNMRRKGSGGTFITAEDVVKRAPTTLTDVFRTVPGLRVVPVGNDYQIESSRNVMGGCVQYWVDGAPWEAMFPGDVDRLYPPQEIGGIEVYQSGTNTPAQFQQAGKTSCAVVVIWSKTRTERAPTGRR
ncbi:MAG: hypothetical protein MNPFHGCM_02648 [Gemmatimonadaceae bacterium]|nr:hypothetical protein [Gemmatimonadaceae bacterium]